MSKLAAIEPGAQGTTVGQVSIGTRHEDAFGRVFYYAFAATAVGRGKVARDAAAIANHSNMSFQTAPAVGDTSVKVTLGGTALTADQYKDGWLVNQDGTGEGRIYKIEGCDAQTSTSGTAVIYLAEQIDIVMGVSESNVDFVYNHYDELLPPADNGQNYLPVGVPVMVGGLGASEYGYIQTWGPAGVWRDEADDALGDEFTWGAGTGTGQIEGRDAVTEVGFGFFGPVAGVDTEYQLAFLQISR